MQYTLEVCAASMQSVAAAAEGGARRIELCSALSLDGLTPSMGMIRIVKERFPQLTLHVLVRPHEGNFVYNDVELATMQSDIIECRKAGADSIVVGALTPEGDIDLAAMQRLMEAADTLPVTFHRAFDVCRHPEEALEQVIALGCRRILTSGQQPTAEQGIPLLHRLNQQADGRIILMPGGGVNATNAPLILQQTGCTEIHASASSLQPNGLKDTDPQKVRAILEALSTDLNLGS